MEKNLYQSEDFNKNLFKNLNQGSKERLLNKDNIITIFSY